jgi:hypothetical protein
MANSANARQGGASGRTWLFFNGARRRSWSTIPTILLASVTLAGCAHWMRENANINGAQQLAVNDAATRRVDLPRLIVALSPNALDATKVSEFTSDCEKKGFEYADGEKYLTSAGRADGEPDAGRGRKCLELATQIFNADAVEQARRRNEIQARLMAASDAECAQFVQHLNSLQGYGNLATGSLTTIFSGAGAIVTGVNAARAFAGLGAITSGLRAEFNSDLFLQQAAPTIGKAISQQRATTSGTIASARAQDIRSYPLWAAIGDAFKYNDQCSLVKGLAAMDRALEVAANPGLDNMEDYWLRLNRIRVLSQNPQITSRSSLDAMSPASTITTSGGAAAGLSIGPQALAQVYQAAVDAAYAGEQQVLSARAGLEPAPDIKIVENCESSNITAESTVSSAADCLRRTTLNKLSECVGKDLPGQFAELTAKEAVVRSSASATPGTGFATATFERDKLLLAAKAQADWIGVVEGYTVGTFASAQELARRAAAADREKRKDDANSQLALALAALKSGMEAVSGTQCLHKP